jgi:hypothetical protein
VLHNKANVSQYAQTFFGAHVWGEANFVENFLIKVFSISGNSNYFRSLKTKKITP